MKKTLLILSFLALLSSCAQTSNGVNSGIIYTSWKDRDPLTKPDNSVIVKKEGKSCVTNILGLFASGDSSLEEAKKVSGISKVSYIDRELTLFNLIYIPIFAKGCTIVKGE
jgi:hypothetical protein